MIISLNRNGEIPLRRQLYQTLREQIVTGNLEAGEGLPSTRELSQRLGISRNTVSEAYEMLISEGYVISSQGAPTRVAEGLYIEKNEEDIIKDKEAMEGAGHPQKGQTVQLPAIADFHTGRPDLREFPKSLWQRMLSNSSQEVSIEQYGYSGAQGFAPLRKEIVSWLSRNRGFLADDQDIFITEGATHALNLVAELLCRDNSRIIMEDPCHVGMMRAFLNKGCQVIPVSVDEHGIHTEFLKQYEGADPVYITPSHQFPLGGILPASRRAALIRYAREKQVYLIEDDYDSEFRYCGEPIAPLYAMDPQRVIYVGTFSKSVFPALRIGFVILPRALQQKWLHLRTYTDVQNPIFEQAALTMFLQTRKMDRHVHRMRRIYGERRKVLLEALKENFGEAWRAYGDDSGLHIAIEFSGLCFDESFRDLCVERRINITPVEYHCIEKGKHQDKLLLGYGHLRPEEIREGIRLLRNLMKEI